MNRWLSDLPWCRRVYCDSDISPARADTQCGGDDHYHQTWDNTSAAKQRVFKANAPGLMGPRETLLALISRIVQQGMWTSKSRGVQGRVLGGDKELDESFSISSSKSVPGLFPVCSRFLFAFKPAWSLGSFDLFPVFPVFSAFLGSVFGLFWHVNRACFENTGSMDDATSHSSSRNWWGFAVGCLSWFDGIAPN